MTVDEYLDRFSGEVRQRLEKIRTLIAEEASEAVEVMSCGVPGYTYKDRNVVLYAGFGKHIGLYPEPETIVAFEQEMQGYETSKGTVRFYHDKPIPYDLIKNMVQYRIKKLDT